MATMNIDPEMAEIAQDFVIEATEGLDALDSKFVELEQNASPELLAELFRVMHTIKGAAGFLSLTPIVQLAHAGEDVMGRLRSGELAVTTHIVDVILETVDTLKALIQEVSAGVDQGVTTDDVVARLRAILAGEDSLGGTEPPAPSEAGTVAPTTESAGAKSKSKKSKKKTAKETAGVGGRECFTGAEFDALIAEARAGSTTENAASKAGGALGAKIDDRDCFTEAEFDALLASFKGEAEPAPAAVGARESKSTAPVKRPEAQGDQTIRIDIRRLDDVMNLVGELVLDRNRIVKIAAQFDERDDDDDLARALRVCAEHLDLVSSDLQAAVTKTRMIPIGKVFGKFPRMLRDLSRDLKKEINLELTGEDTELDKSLVEEIGDPLVHLIRNSADHGIESPEQRIAAGKPRHGTIHLSAFHEGDNIVIQIKDDGKGIDSKVIRRKAIEKGLIDENAGERLSERDVINLIFAPGFSSVDTVTSVSGRGVGMDVVKTNISKLNGLIEIDTAVGKGTTVSLKLPLTLAIIRSLMVDLARRTFAIPLGLILEIVRMTPNEVRSVDGMPVIYLRDSVIPLVDLKTFLGANTTNEQRRWIYAVVVGLAERRYGLIVDHLHGLEEVVIKSMGDVLPPDERLAGATILGDGRVVLILDVPGILQNHAGSYLAAA
ncbi:MAG: chemotaxis protein CheA [Myxococcales bacterium]|nr:chemotaxis protein CheA [Myxococcales bacterium]